MSVRYARRATTIALTAALLAVSVAGCSQPKSVQSLLAEAKNYEHGGDRNAAIIQLKNAVQQDPESKEARHQLAVLYLKNGDAASAEKEIRRAIESGLAAEKSWPVLAKALLAQGQFQKVIDEAPPSARDAASLAVRGDAYAGLRKLDESTKAYEDALRIDPAHPSAIAGMARLKAVKGDLAGAQAAVDKGMAANEKDAELRLLKGRLLQAEGKLAEAREMYAAALSLEPDHVDALGAKALAGIVLKDFTGAQGDVTALRKARPNSVLGLHYQAMLDHAQGKPKEALDSVLQVLRAAPDYPPALLLAGLVQKELGAAQQATDYLQRYLEHDPGNVNAVKQLAALYLTSGEAQRAERLVESALSRNPGDPQLLALAGQSKLQEKRFDKATAYFERAAAAVPDSMRIQTALGVSKMAGGDRAGAIEALEKASRLEGGSLETELLLVQSRVAAKQYEAALASLKKLQAAHPGNPSLPAFAGQIHLQIKDARSARAAFDKALSIDPAFFPAVANLARLDVQDGKPDAARERFLAVLDKNKSDVRAMAALAELAGQRGKVDEATEWLEKANSAQPDDDRIAALLTVWYARTGKSDKALTFAQAFAVKHAEKPVAIEMLANAQLAAKDIEGALESLARLANIAPNQAEVHLRIAQVESGRRNFKAAEEALNKALLIKPDFPEARYAFGNLKIRQGDPKAALAVAHALQKEHPKLAAGHLLEAEAAMASRDHADAVNAMEAALKLQPGSGTMIGLLRAMDSAGRVKDADSRALAWLAQNPKDLAVRTYLGDRELQRNNHKAAIAHYETILRDAPRSVATLNNLAIAYQGERDRRALETAEKAYQLAAEEPAVLDTLGWILVQQGEKDRGIALLRKAVDKAPQARDIRAHLDEAQR